MPYFDRFTQSWALNGNVIEPTVAQADAGFAYLGPVPPSVEGFNAMFQWNDNKDTWLFNQISNVITGAGGTVTEENLQALADAINSKITAATDGVYVKKSGDTVGGTGLIVAPYFQVIGFSMLADVSCAGVFESTNGIKYVGVDQPANAIAFAWNDAVTPAVPQMWVDRTLVGQLVFTSDLVAGYLPLTGGTLLGPLTAPVLALTGTGINYSGLDSPSADAIGFSWSDISQPHMWVNGTDVGVLALGTELGAYLPLAGGTVYGPTYFRNPVYFGPSNDFYLWDDGNFKLTYYAPGVYDGMQTSTQIRNWMNADGSHMTMSAFGHVHISNRLTVAGNGHGMWTDGVNFFRGWGHDPNAWYDWFDPLTGNRYWRNWTNIDLMTLAGTGNLQITGQFMAAGAVYAHSADMGFFSDGGDGRYFQWSNGTPQPWRDLFNASNGDRTWLDNTNHAQMTLYAYGLLQVPGEVRSANFSNEYDHGFAMYRGAEGNHNWQAATNSFMMWNEQIFGVCPAYSWNWSTNQHLARIEPSGWFIMTILGAEAVKQQGINWVNPSDSSLKQNINDYSIGLNEVIQLRPVTYQSNGRSFELPDDGRTHIGLVAEEAGAVIPEAKIMKEMILQPGEEPTEVAMLNFSPINFAFINAFKEISQRLTALEQSITQH